MLEIYVLIKEESPGLATMVKHDDPAMTWYDHGD